MADQSLSPEGNEEARSASTSQLSEEQVLEIMRWREPSDEHKWCDAERTDYNFPVQKTATKGGLIIVFGSMLLYIIDVGSDIILAVFHFSRGRILFGSLTLLIVLLNFVTVGYLSIKWHKEYENSLEMPGWYRYFCFLGPLFPSAFAFNYGRKSIQFKKENNINQSEMYYKKMSDLLFVGSKLSVIEAIMESSLQFVLQVYLYHSIEFEEELTYFSVFSFTTSWLSLSTTMTTSNGRGFFSNVRFVDKDDTSFYFMISRMFRLCVVHCLITAIRTIYFSALAQYAIALLFWLLVLIHVIVISGINWWYGKFNEINKMTTDRIERIVLFIVYVISTLFTDLEMKTRSQRMSRRKTIVYSVAGFENLPLCVFLINKAVTIYPDDELDLVLTFILITLTSCIGFFTLFFKNWYMIYCYVAIETKDGYIFAIETRKPFIGRYHREVTFTGGIFGARMFYRFDPSVKLIGFRDIEDQ